MRLIDADKLIEDVRKNSVSYFADDFAREWVDKQPTIEPEPQRMKGKWIPHREKSREYIGTALVSVMYDYWFCDACGYRVENEQPRYNFCPHCGAEMENGDGTLN